MMEESKNKNNIKIFVARLVTYIMVGFVIPFTYLVWRYNLFSKTERLNIGGWGIIAIIFSAIFFMVLVKKAGETIENETYKQVFDGIRKIFIPLLAVTLCVYAMYDFWRQLVEFLGILTVCETVAYIVNPIPQKIKEKENLREESKIIKIASIFWDSKK